jgi:hypothetical protein
LICSGSRLLQPILYNRTRVNGTQDKPPFPKVLRRFSFGNVFSIDRYSSFYLAVGLPLQNELPEVKYVPETPPNHINYPNMSRRLLACRGIEVIHDKLIHKQYGIMVRRQRRDPT